MARRRRSRAAPIRSCAALAALVLAPGPSQAAAARSLAGDYVCKVDCRPSDAPPSIAIDGTTAICRNDLGGVFYGQVLSSSSISCFNRIGTLSADGMAVTWSNGGVWARRP